MNYTYPQIQDLLSQCNKYIQFEVEIMTAPLRAMFGGGTSSNDSAPEGYNDSEYQEITEDDLGLLARALGG